MSKKLKFEKVVEYKDVNMDSWCFVLLGMYIIAIPMSYVSLHKFNPEEFWIMLWLCPLILWIICLYLVKFYGRKVYYIEINNNKGK